MSAIISKALRREVLALADNKRDGTVASVRKMYAQHAKKAAGRRHIKLEPTAVQKFTESKLKELAL